SGGVVSGNRRRGSGGGDCVIGLGVEVRLGLEIFLCCLGDQPPAAVLLNPFSLAEIISDVLFANPQEASYTNDDELGFTVLGENNVIHVTDLLGIVCGTVVDRSAHNLAHEAPVRDRNGSCWSSILSCVGRLGGIFRMGA